MSEPIITELSCLTRQILFKFRETLAWLGTKSVRFNIGKKSGRSPLHQAAAYPLQQTAETAAVFSASGRNHYRIVMFSKTNFSGDGAAL